MRFGIDLDGVLSNFTSQLVKSANLLWPGRLPDDFVPNDWHYSEVFTRDELKLALDQTTRMPLFWETTPALPGVEELQNYLNNWPKLPEIFFITARLKTIGDSPLVQSSRWLERHNLWPRNGHSTVIPVAEAKHKQDLFRGLGLKFFLDDYAPTVEQLNQIDGMHAYVLDQPWNRYATELPRVFSVTEYLDTIRALAK